jgi:hypothetical protein
MAVSDITGALFGDGHRTRVRAPGHGPGMHRITVTVHDANGLTTSQTMSVVIE